MSDDLTLKSLYHGSNMIVDTPEVRSSAGRFGRELYDGFYVTTDIDEALKYAVSKYMAESYREKEENELIKENSIVVNEYRYIPSKIKGRLHGAIFDSINKDTIDFIRNNMLREHLSTCNFDNDYKCEICTYKQCPRNKDFAYGPLVDAELDSVLYKYLSGQMTEDEAVEKMVEILNESIPYRGCSL